MFEVEAGGGNSTVAEREPFTLESATAGPSQPSGMQESSDSGIAADDGGASVGGDQGASVRQQPGAADQYESQIRELREQLTQQDRRQHQIMGALAPHLNRMVGAEQPNKITLEQLSSPNATLQDLVTYMRQEQAEAQQNLLSQMGRTAERHASEMRWRGTLNTEALGGDTRAYDSMVGKYVRPLYEQNPALKDLVYSEQMGEPALAEYGLACMLRLAEFAKDDPVKAYRALHDFLDGKPSGDTRQAIERAARSGADKIVGNESARRPTRDARGYSAQDFRTMDDSEFAKVERQIMGG